MDHRQLLREIILKYHRGEALTNEEQAMLDAEMTNLPADKVWEQIRSHIEKRPTGLVRALYVRWAVAAAVVVTLGAVGLYRYTAHSGKVGEVLAWRTVAPGHFTAEVEGMVMDSAGGQSVPFPVALPDGSMVTLCYRSSVRYAKGFVKRAVALVGQGFFQVVGNERPFEVAAGKGLVDVLGTEFNWMHYPGLPDEITLYNGKIRLAVGNVARDLKPAERAVIQEGSPIRVRVARMKNPEDGLAWKSNRPSIKFDSTELYTIIQRMAQYYQVGYAVDSSLQTGRLVSGIVDLQRSLADNLAPIRVITKDYAQVDDGNGMIEVKGLR